MRCGRRHLVDLQHAVLVFVELVHDFLDVRIAQRIRPSADGRPSEYGLELLDREATALVRVEDLERPTERRGG